MDKILLQPFPWIFIIGLSALCTLAFFFFSLIISWSFQWTEQGKTPQGKKLTDKTKTKRYFQFKLRTSVFTQPFLYCVLSLFLHAENLTRHNLKSNSSKYYRLSSRWEVLLLFLQWSPHLSLMSLHGQSYDVTVGASALVNNRLWPLTLPEA